MALPRNFIFFIILQVMMSIKSFNGLNVKEDSKNCAYFTIIQFLKNLQDQHNFETLLVMHNSNVTIATLFYGASVETEDNITTTNAFSLDTLLSDQFEEDTPSLGFVGHLMQQMPQVAVLHLDELQTFNLKNHMSDILLAVVQIDVNSAGIQETFDEHHELLRALRLNVQHMTVLKVVLLINYPVAMIELDFQLIHGVVDKLLRYCWNLKLINVIAILSNYKTSMILYRFDPFPTFQVETVNIATAAAEQVEVFPRRLSNLKGYEIPTIIGGTDPRVIHYYTPDGKLFIGGFSGHYMLAFAKRFNCRIHQPIPYNPDKLISSPELMKAVINGTVEWSAALTFAVNDFYVYSYPYEQLDWCIMIPVEADLPGYKLFTLVLNRDTYLLVVCSVVAISVVLSVALRLNGYNPDICDYFCHGDCIRGLLGQTFINIQNPPRIVQAIHLDICILAILLTTAYNAYYSTYKTQAPKEAVRNTMDDVLASGLKVIAYEVEYKPLVARPELKKYEPIFIGEPEFLKYVALRDSFNTKYGYAVPTTKWIIIKEQQKVFTTPLFKQTPGLCIFNGIPMSFPIQENSVFQELLNELITSVYESGLMFFWRRYNFLELIKAGKLSLVDLSPKREFKAMKVDDLQYIFVLMGIIMLMVTIVFAMELLTFHRRRILERVTNLLSWNRTEETESVMVSIE